MITKEEWEAVYREQIDAGRKRSGLPPTFEDVEALSRGVLPPAEADRVRELLSYYPDLLRVFTEALPEGDEGVLTEEEIASDLEKIRRRLRDDRIPQIAGHEGREWRVLAVAAVVVIAIALGSVGVWRMTKQPRALLTVLIYPEASRGIPTATPLRISTDADYILKPVFEPRHPYSEYRLELVDLATAPPKRLWLRDHIARQSDGTYPVPLTTRGLEPGLYRLVLYGVDGTVEDLAEYTLRLKAD